MPRGGTAALKAGPIVKWAGGKGQLLEPFARYLPDPDAYDAYFEPFVGGGALFFHLAPGLRGKRVWLNDTNAELINLYRVVASADVEGLIDRLREHRARHSRDYYYAMRRQQPADPVERAARMVYLNKTCYNGLYRVNSRGEFNVPMGRYRNPPILDEEGLRAAHRLLRELAVELACGDFESVLGAARAGGHRRALIYFDPPYQPVSETAYFTAYTPDGFSGPDQQRLARVSRELRAAGHLVMLSNSYHAAIEVLYQGFHLVRLRANRAINSRPSGRAGVYEYLILGYDPPRPRPHTPPG